MLKVYSCLFAQESILVGLRDQRVSGIKPSHPCKREAPYLLYYLSLQFLESVSLISRSLSSTSHLCDEHTNKDFEQENWSSEGSLPPGQRNKLTKEIDNGEGKSACHRGKLGWGEQKETRDIGGG